MDSYKRGLEALRAGDFETARALLEDASADPRAVGLLGQMASNGNGEPADPAKAARLYERAADGGDAESAYNLAALYATGRGVAQDYAAAMRWYQKAAELGDADAMQKVGVMYAVGQGVPVDLAEAERWWLRAVERGQAEAMADLGTMYDAERDDQTTATRWYASAAEHGCVDAMLWVAQRYRDGIGCAPDLVRAVRWYMEPMSHGNGDGVHEALRLVPRLTAEQVRAAAPRYADSLIATAGQG